MIPLDHPLWRAAKDAFSFEEPVNQVLARLEQTWDLDHDHLIYTRLCHQNTLYSATYLALPHLIRMFPRLAPEHQSVLAADLGYIAWCSLNEAHDMMGGTSLKRLKARGGDWRTAAQFFCDALPTVSSLGRTVWERPESEGDYYLAGGILGADGHVSLAEHVMTGGDGYTTCPKCRSEYAWGTDSGGLRCLDFCVGKPRENATFVPPEPSLFANLGEVPRSLGNLLNAREDTILRVLGACFEQPFHCLFCKAESPFRLS